MSLLVNIQTLPEEGITISEEFERGWLSNIPEYGFVNEEAYIKDSIKLGGTLVKEGNSLRLRGRVEFTIRTLCSRCGEEMDFGIDSRVDLALMPGNSDVAEMEKVLTPEDVNRLYYQGTEVDLTPYFQEQIALDVPMQFLCCNDCKGICPECLANLNQDRCRCVKQVGDPRLSVLRQLKIGK